MKIRRLSLALMTVAVVLGGFGWFAADRLSADERAVAGWWQAGPDGNGQTVYCFLEPDRQFFLNRSYADAHGQGYAGVWSVGNGVLRLDTEEDPKQRALRRVCALVGLCRDSQMEFTIASVAADEIVIALPNGGSEIWTRRHQE
jgi:hypothetical protein